MNCGMSVVQMIGLILLLKLQLTRAAVMSSLVVMARVFRYLNAVTGASTIAPMALTRWTVVRCCHCSLLNFMLSFDDTCLLLIMYYRLCACYATAYRRCCRYYMLFLIWFYVTSGSNKTSSERLHS